MAAISVTLETFDDSFSVETPVDVASFIPSEFIRLMGELF
jgi:hypothetical protein